MAHARAKFVAILMRACCRHAPPSPSPRCVTRCFLGASQPPPPSPPPPSPPSPPPPSPPPPPPSPSPLPPCRRRTSPVVNTTTAERRRRRQTASEQNERGGGRRNGGGVEFLFGGGGFARGSARGCARVSAFHAPPPATVAAAVICRLRWHRRTRAP